METTGGTGAPARGRTGLLSPDFTLLPVGVAVIVLLNVILLFVGAGVERRRYTGPFYDLRGTLKSSECAEVADQPVVFRDQDDNVIGETRSSGSVPTGGGACAVTFALEVPKVGFYKFEVGELDGPMYSFEELERTDFVMELTLNE